MSDPLTHSNGPSLKSHSKRTRRSKKTRRSMNSKLCDPRPSRVAELCDAGNDGGENGPTLPYCPTHIAYVTLEQKKKWQLPEWFRKRYRKSPLGKVVGDTAEQETVLDDDLDDDSRDDRCEPWSDESDDDSDENDKDETLEHETVEDMTVKDVTLEDKTVEHDTAEHETLEEVVFEEVAEGEFDAIFAFLSKEDH